MSKCKICKGDLYQTISFQNIFKNNYSVHDECMNNIVINSDRTVFPITGNTVYFDYIFFEVNSRYDYEYLEQEYMHILLSRNLMNKNWSIIIQYEKGLFDAFSPNEFLILFSLASSPILIVSLVFVDLSVVFLEEI